MTHSQWLWAHVSFALVVAAALVAATARMRAMRRSCPDREGDDRSRPDDGDRQAAQRPSTCSAPTSMRWIVFVAFAFGLVLARLPLGEIDLAGYLLAFSGELSFATLFFLIIYLASQSAVGASVEDRAWNIPRLVWLVAGSVLYVSALGGRGADVYSLGFGPLAGWLGLAAAALLAIGGRWLGAVLLLGIMVSWQLRLSGSVNFWDYAIDPFIFLGSLVHVLLAIREQAASVSGITRCRERKLSVTPTDEASAAVS